MLGFPVLSSPKLSVELFSHQENHQNMTLTPQLYPPVSAWRVGSSQRLRQLMRERFWSVVSSQSYAKLLQMGTFSSILEVSLAHCGSQRGTTCKPRQIPEGSHSAIA